MKCYRSYICGMGQPRKLRTEKPLGRNAKLAFIRAFAKKHRLCVVGHVRDENGRFLVGWKRTKSQSPESKRGEYSKDDEWFLDFFGVTIGEYEPDSE